MDFIICLCLQMAMDQFNAVRQPSMLQSMIQRDDLMLDKAVPDTLGFGSEDMHGTVPMLIDTDSVQEDVVGIPDSRSGEPMDMLDSARSLVVEANEGSLRQVVSSGNCPGFNHDHYEHCQGSVGRTMNHFDHLSCAVGSSPRLWDALIL